MIDSRLLKLFFKYRYSGAKKNTSLLSNSSVFEYEFERWLKMIELHKSWRRLLRAIAWQFGIKKLLTFINKIK